MRDQTLSSIGPSSIGPSSIGLLGLNSGLVICAIALCSSAQAQTVTTDGSTNTSVSRNGFFSITEGTLRSGDRSTALFHSFDSFSPAQTDVVFDLRNSQNAIDTSNVNTIISRVTGGTESFIDGFLGIEQDAGTPTPDLFFD